EHRLRRPGHPPPRPPRRRLRPPPHGAGRSPHGRDLPAVGRRRRAHRARPAGDPVGHAHRAGRRPLPPRAHPPHARLVRLTPSRSPRPCPTCTAAPAPPPSSPRPPCSRPPAGTPPAGPTPRPAQAVATTP